MRHVFAQKHAKRYLNSLLVVEQTQTHNPQPTSDIQRRVPHNPQPTSDVVCPAHDLLLAGRTTYWIYGDLSHSSDERFCRYLVNYISRKPNKMRLIFAILLLQVAALFPSSVSAADERTYKVYHRIGGGDFAERGSVVLSAGEENGEDDNASAASSDATLTATATNAADCIVPTAVDEMVSNGSMYTVKVVDEQTGQSAAASVPGCDVRRANFREEIGLTLSQTGSLVSVTYTPLVSPLAPSCHSLQPLLASDEEQVPEFKTTITYETCKPAMTVPLVLPKVKAPPGLKLYPRKKAAPGEDGAAGGSGGGGAAFEDEEKAQNQSFLMKYWYIILPIIILQFVGSPEPPPEEGGQGGGGGARAAGGAAVAAAGAGASAPRQRRGKRD